MSGYPGGRRPPQQQPQPVVYQNAQQRPQPVVYQQQQQPVVYQQQPIVYQQQPIQGQPVQYVQQVQPQGAQPVVMQQPVVLQTYPPQGQATQVPQDTYPANPEDQQPMDGKTKAKVKEACGDTPCEKLMCGISVFLWFMAFIEMPALFIFATSFSRADEQGCCGVIAQPSHGIEGATCHEDNIMNGTIPRKIINGSILCLVNGQTCMDYTFKIDDLDGHVDKTEATEYNSLPDCLQGGGYELEDLCGEDTIKYAVKAGGSYEAVLWCYIAVVLAFLTNCISVLDWCGYCKGALCDALTRVCGFGSKKCGQGCGKMFEVLVWVTILAATTQNVENPAANGYEAEDFSVSSDVEKRYDNMTFNAREIREANETYATLDIDVEPAWYAHNVCGIDRDGESSADLLWIDYDIDVPEWVLSDWYGTVAYIGIAGSVTEMSLFFLWLCLCKKKDEEQKTQQAIQMSKPR
eukprot:54230_1